MTLELPRYVEQAQVVGSSITYDWNAGDPVRFYIEDDRLANQIGRSSVRGVVAIAAGSAEWVAWRLSQQCDVSIPLAYIEAVWAGLVDWRYMREVRQVPEAMSFLRGKFSPECQPVKLIIGLLDGVVQGAKETGKIGLAASSLARLGLTTMPAREPYQTWRRTVIQRMQKVHPRDPDDPLGVPIARQELDPDYDDDPGRAQELIATFLRGLDPERNPFLASPEEMTRKGFVGTPYTL